jgi:hypothetical protein
MSRAELVLSNDATRQRAVKWAMIAPPGTRLTFTEPKRTLPQNDRMWACLTEIARQLPWHGVKLSPDDWKLIFLSALKQEMRLVPNLDGTGFVQLGRSSSDLSRAEFAELLALVDAFAAEHGVSLGEPDKLSPTPGTREKAREVRA